MSCRVSLGSCSLHESWVLCLFGILCPLGILFPLEYCVVCLVSCVSLGSCSLHESCVLCLVSCVFCLPSGLCFVAYGLAYALRHGGLWLVASGFCAMYLVLSIVSCVLCVGTYVGLVCVSRLLLWCLMSWVCAMT